MPSESAIRLKVLNKAGQFSDVLEEVQLGDQNDNEDLQRLILIPKHPLQGTSAKCLRVVFYSLVITSIACVLLILARDHFSSRITEDSQLYHQWKKSQAPYFSSKSQQKKDLCQVVESRFECHPEPGATEDACIKRGCCWSQAYPQSEVPWCFYPYGFSYYAFKNFTSSTLGLKGSAISVRASPYPKDVKNLNIDVIYETEDIVRIKITDATRIRYEVPLNYATSEKKTQSQNYFVKQQKDGFQIFRKDEQFPLFDSTVAPMLYSNQYLQISTSIVSTFLYGIGEVVDSLKRDTNYKRYVLYARDQIPGENRNLYGSHPFYMSVDKSGRAYGVFLANSNAMEIVLQPGNFLTFRSIGGILDLRVFIGPKPSDVMNQYTKIIGRPIIPPYWSLGFHLCRFNYGTLNHTAEILENNLRAGIPIDVQWNDLDYMRHQDDFTVDPKKFAGLKDFVEDLHSRGMRYVPIIDPGISAGSEVATYEPYLEGLKMDIFVKNDHGAPFIGKVWNPNATVWPDFSHPNVTKYWLNQLEDFRKKVAFDGAWIDMNEPSNFDDGEHNVGCDASNSLNNPPYLPRLTGGTLYSKTLCPSARQAGGRHYDLHNLYGTMETIVTYKALGDLTGERPFIISRSTFPGQGKYGGHWSGDVVSSWEDMRQTIPQILSFGLFGIPLVGADICGFNGNTSKELCKRWMQLGAFYPFARNHNTDDGIPQDPASLGPEVIQASKETLNVRYSLLPYIYTLFFQAHLTGSPVARALFYEFPEDTSTFFVDTSFMLGPAVMIVPILEQGYEKSTIKAYLPKGWWYQHYFSEIIDSLGEERELRIPENSIPVLYKGGTIIMKQDPALNTKLSRQNSFHIQAFLSQGNNATGDFYWDDGVSNLPDTLVQYDHYTFKAENNVLTMEKALSGYDSSNMTLDSIEIRGVQFTPNSVILNNVAYNFTYSEADKSLKLDKLSQKGSSWTDGLSLVWK